ncbi:MAG: polymerase sigma-70 factor, subfamily [Chloroflexota bacterium]|jgi:RNA polymerase sigma-70 factor (ECF subfamily)|nr:polymerase sigma-70 factor, subfamily [Chloroflexota bacterium]
MGHGTRVANVTIERAVELEHAHSDAAISAFVALHYDRLLGLARLVCRDTSDAADAVQTGLERAWRRRSTLRDEALLRPWLDRIVTREAVRVSKSRSSRLSRLFTLHPDVTPIDSADARASAPAAYVALRAAFGQLSPEQRAVVALHLHLGYSVAETAAIVGAPDDTVRSRLRTARLRLRHELEESRP